MTSVKDNLESVLSQLETAAARSGRHAADIAIVAVTKGVPTERILEAREAGLRRFGENRVQEAEPKVAAIPDVEWHFIGGLQRNKVGAAVALFPTIQSVDSVRLAREIGERAVEAGRTVEALLEINLSGAPQRHGFSGAEVYAALDEIGGIAGVRVGGLMGIAPHPAEDGEKRKAFATLRGLFGVCKSMRRPGVEMRWLSMGMSDDFTMAVEEGANMVRLGRRLFA